MRIYNPATNEQLQPALKQLLHQLRAERSFDAAHYIERKARTLNAYMAHHNLRHCVVGTSGGIDSAVVLALAARAKAMPESRIERIVALSLPVHDAGATGQDDAADRAAEAAEAVGAEFAVVDLSSAFNQLAHTVESACAIKSQAWARGQLVSYLRTPALYYATSLLTQEGAVGIVLGTTNLDEGGYLGYFGKASDGMVDVQMISDLHKSEVYDVAHKLHLPNSVIDVVPSGDMYDSRPDEEVFGAPYDFVELYMQWLRMSVPRQHALTESWDAAAKDQFARWRENLERMHQYNGHKYLGRSPAVHLDICDVAVPGGWENPSGAIA